MRRYAQVSGTFFAVIAVAHLVRVLMGWPLQLADLTIPAWASIGGFLFTAGFALWAFRTAKSVANTR
jgi:hypothetical protein